MNLKRYYTDIKSINTVYSTITNKSVPDNILVDKFSTSTTTTVRLAILKVLVARLYHIILHDEQLMTVLALQYNSLVEVKTGEGKSICIIVNAILETLKGNKVYIATHNGYLAERDYLNFKPLLDLLNINSSYNIELLKMKDETKERIHSCSVIYTECSELCFDYMRDRLEFTNNVVFDTIIVDEVDFVLIDNATNTCNLSMGVSDMDVRYLFYYSLFNSILDDLTYTEITKDEGLNYDLWDVDYIIVKSLKTVIITQKGMNYINDLLHTDILGDGFYNHLLSLVLEVNHCYAEGIDYIVQNGKVWVINQNNGRVSEGTTYEIDLQNAIEVKHGLELTLPSSDEESISYQVFYKKFKNLQGLSGTLSDVEDEFSEIFQKSLVVIPTHKECVRRDFKSRYFKTRDSKLNHLVKLLGTLPPTSPKLIITSDDNDANEVSSLLSMNKLPHFLIDNENLNEEESILDKSGKPGMITVSTPICGRGTDIKLDSVSAKTGLVTISLNHFENSRIDYQIRGRSGRQGQLGSTYFLSSLDDKLWRVLPQINLDTMLSMSDSLFYSPVTQDNINSKREDLQKSLYNQYLQGRYKQFTGTYSLEIFRDKINSLYANGITLDNIDKILTHTYSIITGLSDSDVILAQLEDYRYDELYFDTTKLGLLSRVEYMRFFKQFDLEIQEYIATSANYRTLEELIYHVNLFCNDYYMYYLKQFIFLYLVGDDNGKV